MDIIEDFPINENMVPSGMKPTINCVMKSGKGSVSGSDGGLGHDKEI